ncbi:LON peptidase substrate-binding domain-containing protein [Mycolicibacterium confluentis]|uniref:ATP-dependent protease n=1 Tax=Mycolicibacterium confluentis TaxID=28047 RepID=A0A7I7Y1J5_9MYCO|nr:ATP-dependent protease [Mycolicibacterium confluentis]BBZ35498.1 ATP-dependent protease [Mycolicibacterium confluentis]
MQTPMFPLQSAFLPGEALPLRVFEPRYGALVRDCLAADDPAFGVVLIARGREVGGDDEREDIGALAHIVTFADHGNGQYQLRCVVRERFRVTEWLPDDPYPRAAIELWPDEPGGVTADDIGAVEDQIMRLMERIASARNTPTPPRDAVFGDMPEDPGSRLYALATVLPMNPADRYAVLAAPSPATRLPALREAVETVAAMVEFQLSGD